MPKRKGKAVSFDAMVKFFMHQYNIPTKKDVERILERLDRLEKLIKSAASAGRGRRVYARAADGGAPMAASDLVLETIKKSKQGLGFADIRESTGFGEKKLRNIIFRLHKMNKINRVSRGVYKAAEGD